MDTTEKELLQNVIGELRVQRHRRELDKFEKYPRLQRQLEMALLIPSEELRRKRLELLATDLREDMAALIKSSFLDDFDDYQQFLSQGQKAPLYPAQNEVPAHFKQAMAKYKEELQEQVVREIEASYKPLMEQAKAKDARLPRGANGRIQTKHQSELEDQMIMEEHKRLESNTFRNQLLAEERRLLQEHRRVERIQSNPLTQKVQK